MKEIKFNKFLCYADDLLENAARGDESYIVETKAGKAIIISETDYNRLIAAGDNLNEDKQST